MVERLTRFFLLISLIGCSIASRKEQSDLRLKFSQKEFLDAQDILNESSIKKDSENELLYLMEQGTLFYYQKQYKKSSQVFHKANQLVDKLYTKSIKELLATALINENSKTFYGAVFERSLLYYYQAMSFYQLGKQGFYFEDKRIDGKKEKVKVVLSRDDLRNTFNQVRSTLIAWDSFFKELNQLSGIKTILRYDLFAKQVAADIHRALGSRRDKEIALQLYKDAYSILKEIGPSYVAYNNKYAEYNFNLREKYDRKIKKIPNTSIDFTDEFKNAKLALITNILTLHKKMRPNTYRRELKKYDLGKNKLESVGSRPVQILIETGMISALKGKDFSYNLRSAINNIESPETRAVINGIGVPILTYFAMGPLGLGYVSHHGNLSIYSHHGVGETLAKEVGIEFELPYVEPKKSNLSYFLKFYKGEELIVEKELIIQAPLNDIAFINSQEIIENSFSKRAARVGVKYITAILGAYSTYNQMNKNGNELFARPAAFAQFLVSQKAIKETERADVRHWTTLPGYILKSELQLDSGVYVVKFIEKTDRKTVIKRELNLGKIEIKNNKPVLFSFRSF